MTFTLDSVRIYQALLDLTMDLCLAGMWTGACTDLLANVMGTRFVEDIDVVKTGMTKVMQSWLGKYFIFYTDLC